MAKSRKSSKRASKIKACALIKAIDENLETARKMRRSKRRLGDYALPAAAGQVKKLSKMLGCGRVRHGIYRI